MLTIFFDIFNLFLIFNIRRSKSTKLNYTTNTENLNLNFILLSLGTVGFPFLNKVNAITHSLFSICNQLNLGTCNTQELCMVTHVLYIKPNKLATWLAIQRSHSHLLWLIFFLKEKKEKKEGGSSLNSLLSNPFPSPLVDLFSEEREKKKKKKKKRGRKLS